MTSTDWFQLAFALLLVIFAGFIAAGEAALSSFSKSRADRLVAEKERPGAKRVRQIADDPPRYLNTALFLRTVWSRSPPSSWWRWWSSPSAGRLAAGAITAGVMIVVSYVVLGRRAAHAGPAARTTRSPARWPVRWSW